MNEKYLPIGSVVMLKNASKKIMITGYLSIADEDEKTIYDYNACLYPEGFLSSDQTCLFNHDQIDKVYFTGFIDDEEKEFQKNLQEFSNNLKTKDVETLE